MPLIINELKEFVEPDPPDRDERRERIYASCARVDPRKFRGMEEPAPKPSKVGERRKCRWCGAEFTAHTANHMYCSAECSRECQNAVKRERAAARRMERI